MILVTGVSGYVGGQALATLLHQGHPAIGMVRSKPKAGGLAPETTLRIADYDDPKSLRHAFDGVSTLLFISSDGDGRDVLRHHANVIDAATSQKVPSIVFTSIIDVDAVSPFYYAPVYRDAERRLRDASTGWTVLRCGLYSDFVLDHSIRPALPTGVMSLPVGDRRIAPITRNDVALAVAAAAASPKQHAGKTYELTGPQLLSFHDVAAAAVAGFGRPLAFNACSAADYLQRAWAELDDPWPFAFSTLCRSIAEGRYERTTDAVQQLVGRPATTFETFVREAAAA